MNVNEFYGFVKFYIKKEKGDQFSPDDFNLLLPRCQDDFFIKEYGLPEDYRAGSPFPKIAAGLTQKITDDLLPLLQPLKLYLDTDGKMVYPSDYVDVSSIASFYRIIGLIPQWRPVEIMDDDKLAGRESNPNKQPTTKYPICSMYSETIDFLPVTGMANTVVRFTYYRYPKKPFRAYNVVNDVDVYDATNSTQIELPAMTHPKMVRIMLSYVGINLRDEMVTAYAQYIKDNGV